jgi:pimeloyl-ACP methyl ester carboxylesterase
MQIQHEPDDDIFVVHSLSEQRVDIGEVRLNYAKAGKPDRPAVLLLPAQTESWWGYESAMAILAEHFEVYAVDLRGQGRSTRTPGRYTFDNIGNDLVRFIDAVIQRETLVSGNSSGGVLAGWLAANAKPGQVRGALCEDPPFFACETMPAFGHSIRESAGPWFALLSKWLGDQWSIGNWDGMLQASPNELPSHVLTVLIRSAPHSSPDAGSTEIPQHMREYDPEWARAFAEGTVGASCDHEEMLRRVRAPMLLTHHHREIEASSGNIIGAISDEQVAQVRRLVGEAGQRFDYVDLPGAQHQMHFEDPERFSQILIEWEATLS